MSRGYLWTGQTSCHSIDGSCVDCEGSGQDAEFRTGIPWPTQRFVGIGEVIIDQLTDLTWLRDANRAEYPMTWVEALAFVATLNNGRFLDYGDWRLPNRRELLSILSRQTRKPALPENHPFLHVFSNWYWSSTSAAPSPAHAWCAHMEGARLFYGGKDQSYMVWPVRGQSRVLPVTGQTRCFDEAGREVPCAGSGQDGDHKMGLAWPKPRFALSGDDVLDKLTALRWRRCAHLTHATVDWQGALAAVRALNHVGASWRLPTIHELESLVDCGEGRTEVTGAGSSPHDMKPWLPALPQGHLFSEVQIGYWSSTSSLFEPDWAWALYLDKGAVGVGQKSGRHFHAWAVRDDDTAA
ncbi:MAG: Lcl C-terminal domain-containing protein [Acidiferrobacter sp.]